MSGEAAPVQAPVQEHVHDYDGDGGCVHCGRDLFAGDDPDGSDEYRLTDAGRTTAAVMAPAPPPAADRPAIAALAAAHGLAAARAAEAWQNSDEPGRDQWREIAAAAVTAARLAQPEELRAAMTETREVRSIVELLLGLYRPVSGGWASRTSIGRLTRIALSAGVMPPSHATAQGDVPDEEAAAVEDSAPGLAAATRALDIARDEISALRSLAADILGEFKAAGGDGHRARVGQVGYARWVERAGLGG